MSLLRPAFTYLGSLLLLFPLAGLETDRKKNVGRSKAGTSSVMFGSTWHVTLGFRRSSARLATTDTILSCITANCTSDNDEIYKSLETKHKTIRKDIFQVP